MGTSTVNLKYPQITVIKNVSDKLAKLGDDDSKVALVLTWCTSTLLYFSNLSPTGQIRLRFEMGKPISQPFVRSWLFAVRPLPVKLL